MAQKHTRGPLGRVTRSRLHLEGRGGGRSFVLPGPAGLGGHWLDYCEELSREATGWMSGMGKSVLISILTPLGRILGKEDSPYSIALLKHYVEGSGDAFTLESIPEKWQEWIIQATKAQPGRHRDLNPYNSGLYDLRNSLGHFDVTVTVNKNGSKTYAIQDVYQFAWKTDDKAQSGRHGFPLGDVSEEKLALIRRLLPSQEYHNPGGFEERFEVKRVGKEIIFFIPQAFLAAHGKKFEVKGAFTQ
jgi:hypothetical protein